MPDPDDYDIPDVRAAGQHFAEVYGWTRLVWLPVVLAVGVVTFAGRWLWGLTRRDRR